MRRILIALGVVATLALAAPAPSEAAGPIRRLVGRLFGRPPVQRQLNIQVGGGRGVQIQRRIIRQAPVVRQRQRFVGARRGH